MTISGGAFLPEHIWRKIPGKCLVSSYEGRQDPTARLVLDLQDVSRRETREEGRGQGQPLLTLHGLSRPVKLPHPREVKLISSNTVWLV